MPALNHKGPMGEGPMTGRQMGKCTNFGANQKKESTQDQQNLNDDLSENDSRGFGFGFGFGRRGRGRGRGIGRQNRFRGGN